MKLVDEGKVDLDTPLPTYIPEFKMADERYKNITPRMLLNHSSGLMGSSFKSAFLLGDNDTYAVDSLLTQLESQRLKADPGAYSVYCNDGFTLAQILVGRISNIDFTSFIHKNFSEPLGLNYTKTPLDEFAQVFMHEGVNLLSRASLTVMETNEAEKGVWVPEGDSALEFGLGWDNMNVYPFNEYGIKALVKGGDTQLFHGSLIVLPEHNMAAAVVSSGGASTYDQLLATSMLLDQLKEKGIIDEIKPVKTPVAPVVAAMPKELILDSGICGATIGTYEVQIKEEGQLILKSLMVPVPDQTFIYTEEGYFVSPYGSIKVKIVEESNGHKYLWARGYSNLPGVGEMAISDYQLQKMEANETSEGVRTAWEAHQGKKYFILNEKYSAQTYLMLPINTLELQAYLTGYVAGNKIVDENHAISNIQIPGVGGRDAQDIELFVKGDVEYLKVGSYIGIREEGVKDLAYAKEAICTIQEDGYTR